MQSFVMTRAQLEEILKNESPAAGLLDKLDNREMEIFSLISQGSNSSNICRELQITPEQLSAQKKQIQAKLKLKDDVQLIQFAAKSRVQ